jgi:uncharacterized protein (DUF1015 family)
VRPVRDKVGLIASRPYQTYSKTERDARMKSNPFSFLHIVNPGYRYQKKISGEARYELVRNRYEEFKEEGIFIRDEKPCFYVYKIVNRDKKVFHGIVAAASTEDYEKDIIKKHEDTLHKREVVFKDYLKTVGFNAEPVLLTYPDNDSLDAIIEKTMSERAEYEFTTTYRDTHYLWKIDDEKVLKEIQTAFSGMEKLYIADGHHRSASSHLLAQDLKSNNPKHTGAEAYNYFMAYLIPESDLRIGEFNRVVRDLNDLSKEAFLIKLDTHFRIENRGHKLFKPEKKHQFSMYLDGDFYSLSLRESVHKHENSLSELDAQILFKNILEPILGIHDPRNDDRISYIPGHQDMVFVKDLVDKGKFKVGFGMLPATVDEMKQIADEGLTMPPKSTYIEPKLRNGILIYEF